MSHDCCGDGHIASNSFADGLRNILNIVYENVHDFVSSGYSLWMILVTVISLSAGLFASGHAYAVLKVTRLKKENRDNSDNDSRRNAQN